MRRVFFLSALLFSTSLSAHATEEQTALTVYSKAQPGAISADIYRPVPGQNSYRHYNQIPGYAIVRQTRRVNLPKPRTVIEFNDVAALIDPTTVQVTSKKAPKQTTVVEQNYLYDLVSPQKMMERFLGETIIVEQVLGEEVDTISGQLLNASGGSLILQDEDGKVRTVNGYSNIEFPSLPGGLNITPTLKWDIYTEKPGEHLLETSYQTNGITWWADYNAEYLDGDSANEGLLHLSAWVSLINQSGATYEDAKLKLIAGDVNKVQPQQKMYARGAMMEMDAVAASAPVGFDQKSFFEFHLYTLGRPATLPDRSTKQLELFPKATNIPVQKEYIYQGTNQRYYGNIQTSKSFGEQSSTDVGVYVSFENAEAHGLGIPLPAGRIRVNKRDSDDSLEFIGEDTIDHTPRNEEVMLKLGNAFDVKGERKQTAFYIDNTRRTMTESFEITLTNRKDEPVTVTAVETLYRGNNARVTERSHSFEQKDAFTIEFPVEVGADQKETIRYTVNYTW